MAKYDFDQLIPRRGTNSVKWDEEPAADILPMWVADMDFRTAPCVVEALRRRVEHGVYGYATVPESYYGAVTSWFARRHGWAPGADWILPVTGVIPALSAILRALTRPGDRVFPAGKIEKGAVANPAAHTYDVRATLDNAAGELLPGMVCRVTVSPAESAEEIAVPLRAVQQAGDGSRFVWTVRGDSAVRTAVTTGRLVNNGIVLTGGVAAGDRIVVDGMQKIGEGSKVVWR